MGAWRWLGALIVFCGGCASAWAASDLEHLAEAKALFERAQGHRLVLLGEKHGTREIPQFVAVLSDLFAARAPVTVGLEIHASEQAALSAYLASDGGAAAATALRGTPFWSVVGAQHDGRRSEDMLDLIEHLRQMRRAGRDVEVLAYDLPASELHTHPERDKAMADALREYHAGHPNRLLLVLTGNVHAMSQRPGYAPPEMQQPMGTYLQALAPLTVDIRARDGEFWACMAKAKCGPASDWPVEGSGGPLLDGVYHWQVVLPRFTVARLLGSPQTSSEPSLMPSNRKVLR